MARVLVADDEPDVRLLVSTVLTEEGHSVVVAADGAIALDKLEGEKFDVLVLDVMMPRVDGYAVLKRLKALGMRDSLKVLVLTAKGAERDWVRGFRLGADHYVTKPFDIDELTQAVEDLLSLSSDQLRERRERELDRAQLLSRLESIFEEP